MKNDAELFEEGLDSIALNAAYSFMIFCRGLADQAEVERYKKGLREGLDLLTMLSRVHQASKEGEKTTDLTIRNEHELVRNHLFVSRVTHGQTGYDAYEAVIREAVKKELERLLVDIQIVEDLTRKAISDSTSLLRDEQDLCQEFFAKLSIRMNHPE